MFDQDVDFSKQFFLIFVGKILRKIFARVIRIEETLYVETFSHRENEKKKTIFKPLQKQYCCPGNTEIQIRCGQVDRNLKIPLR